MAVEIQDDYQQDKSTGYIDLQQFTPLLDNMSSDVLVQTDFGVVWGFRDLDV